MGAQTFVLVSLFFSLFFVFLHVLKNCYKMQMLTPTKLTTHEEFIKVNFSIKESDED